MAQKEDSSTPCGDLEGITAMCTEHTGKILDRFCNDHDKVCCKVCIHLDHSKCRRTSLVSDLSNGTSSTEKYKDLASEYNRLIATATSVQASITLSDQSNEKYRRQSVSNIKAGRKALDQLLEKMVGEALKKVDAAYQGNADLIRSAEYACQSVLVEAKATAADLDANATAGRENQLFVTMKLSHGRLAALEDDLRQAQEVDVSSFMFTQEEMIQALEYVLSAVWSTSFMTKGDKKARCVAEIGADTEEDNETESVAESSASTENDETERTAETGRVAETDGTAEKVNEAGLVATTDGTTENDDGTGRVAAKIDGTTENDNGTVRIAETATATEKDNEIGRVLDTDATAEKDEAGRVEEFDAEANKEKEAQRLVDFDVRASGDRQARCNITGMVVLDDDLLILTDPVNSAVKLVDAKHYKVTCRLPMPSSPYDVTRTKSDQVAVSMGGTKKIQILTVSDVLTRSRTIDVPSDVFRGLCYDGNNFILACYVARAVKIVNMNGELIRAIYTDSAGNQLFQCPEYVVLSRTKDVIYVSDSRAASVTTMTSTGRVLAVYRTDKLKFPQGLTIGQQGEVFVACSGNQTVHRLTSSGRCGKILLDNRGLTAQPVTVAYCENRDRLYVSTYTGQHGGKQIGVFQFE